MLHWYNILHGLGMLIREEESPADEAETAAEDKEQKAGDLPVEPEKES